MDKNPEVFLNELGAKEPILHQGGIVSPETMKTLRVTNDQIIPKRKEKYMKKLRDEEQHFQFNGKIFSKTELDKFLEEQGYWENEEPSPEYEKDYVYLVGKYEKGVFPDTIWEVQGIFDSENKAVKACTKDNYFYTKLKMNSSLPEETLSFDISKSMTIYPLREKRRFK